MSEQFEARIVELERQLRDKDDLLVRERRLRGDLVQDRDATNRLLDVLANDLRPPANAVVAWADMLQRETLDKTGRDRAIARIERSARTQLGLLDELLDLAKMGSGMLRLDLTTVEMAAVAGDALHDFETKAREKGVLATFVNLAGGGRVLADMYRLQQIVAHLLSNALRFTPEAGTITVESRRETDWLHLSVHDSGPGISPARLPKIFDLEHRPVGDAVRTERPGLGLYLVRRLVEIHHGTVGARNDEERGGAVFTVSLPFCHEARPPAPRSDVQLSAKARPLHGTRLLVVDDDVDARELVALMLRNHGATVAVASEVSTGLGLFEVWRPDLVLTDIGLHVHDGHGLATDLRQRYPKLPIVAMSGNGGPRQANHAVAAGFDWFLQKPLDQALVVETLGLLLTSRK